MSVRQSKNGNVVITKDGNMIVVSSSKSYHSDEELKEIAEKQLKYLQKE